MDLSLSKCRGSPTVKLALFTPVVPSENFLQKRRWKPQRNEVILKDQCPEVEQDGTDTVNETSQGNTSPPHSSVRREARDTHN